MILTNANNGASGKAATNNVIKPYCITERDDKTLISQSQIYISEKNMLKLCQVEKTHSFRDTRQIMLICLDLADDSLVPNTEFMMKKWDFFKRHQVD